MKIKEIDPGKCNLSDWIIYGGFQAYVVSAVCQMAFYGFEWVAKRLPTRSIIRHANQHHLSCRICHVDRTNCLNFLFDGETVRLDGAIRMVAKSSKGNCRLR